MTESPDKVPMDLSALQNTLLKIMKLVGRETGIRGVVKSDAYSHGLIPVAKKLQMMWPDELTRFPTNYSAP